MNSKLVVFNVLLLAGVITLAQFTFKTFTKTEWPHWALHFLFGWLFVASLGGYALLESQLRSKPKHFVNTFMLLSGLRMMFSILIVVFLVLYFPVNGKYISIYYVTGYLLFLIVEVIFLFKRTKQTK